MRFASSRVISRNHETRSIPPSNRVRVNLEARGDCVGAREAREISPPSPTAVPIFFRDVLNARAFAIGLGSMRDDVQIDFVDHGDRFADDSWIFRAGRG